MNEAIIVSILTMPKTRELCGSLIALPGYRARKANPGAAILTVVILYRLSAILNNSLRFQQLQVPICEENATQSPDRTRTSGAPSAKQRSMQASVISSFPTKDSDLVPGTSTTENHELQHPINNHSLPL